MCENPKLLYRRCQVTGCGNNSRNFPEKTFFYIPKQPTRRNSWLLAIGKDPEAFSKRSDSFVCEDHFDIENDMENYIKWQMTGCAKVLKPNVVPHRQILDDGNIVIPSVIPQAKRARLDLPCTVTSESELRQDITVSSNEVPSQELVPPPPSEIAVSSVCANVSPSSSQRLEIAVCDFPRSNISESVDFQTPKKHFRSKRVQVSVPFQDKLCSPIKFTVDSATSPAVLQKQSVIRKKIVPSQLPLYMESPEKSSTSVYVCNTTSDTSENPEPEDFTNLINRITIRQINENPKRYLGIPKEAMYIIDCIKKYTQLDTTSIYLTLKKIRSAHTLAELSDDFGISEPTATRLFKNSVTLMSQLMQELVIFPSKEDIQDDMPMPFRARFANVTSIIDCLEIEIQKPSDAVEQALTWSEYKKTNTIKYLVSATPDGIINYISKGFGGRTSDAVIVEECGYLDKLEPEGAVMADRGFKHIEHLLVQRKCTLVRPPSVSSGEKLKKEEVLLTKRIASLRIHIERIIRRIREYKFLKPHACVHKKLVPLMDHIIIIACGLANLQGPIVK